MFIHAWMISVKIFEQGKIATMRERERESFEKQIIQLMSSLLN